MALSRTPHGLLDMCTPLLAAELWLGHLPGLKVILKGMIAAYAGYTAVYALNDIVDYRNDKKKINQAGFHRDTDYLDAAYIRHPLAPRVFKYVGSMVWENDIGSRSTLTGSMLGSRPGPGHFMERLFYVSISVPPGLRPGFIIK